MLMEESQPMHEISEEFHQPEGGHEVVHLFIPGIFQPTGVCVQVPHYNGVTPREAVELLL